LRYRDIESSTLRNSWHKLSNAGDDDDGDNSPSPSSLQHPLLLSIHGDDNGRDNDEEEDEEDEYIVTSCMYATCASEISSCRLLFLPLRDRVGVDVGDDDDDDDDDDGDVVVVVGCERAAIRKEGRRKRRVTEVKTETARMLAGISLLFGLLVVLIGFEWA
jgi:hypothetical protein